MAKQGSWYPALLTLGITFVFLSWGFYGFSGAGRIKRLPFLSPALVLISSVFILRGLGVAAPLFGYTGHSVSFTVWSSLISLAIGVLYAVGVRQMWQSVS